MSFFSLFPQINLQPKHAGAAVKEKVVMPIHPKSREALLTGSYRKPGPKLSSLSFKQ